MLNAVIGPSDGVSTDDALVRWDGTTGRLVQNSGTTLSDAGALALPVGGSLALANLAGAVNFERVRLSQGTNIFTLYTEAGGTGTQRAFRVGSSAGYIEMGSSSGTYSFAGAALSRFFTQSGATFQFAANITTQSTPMHEFTGLSSLSSTSAIQVALAITPTINQASGTGGYKALRVNVTETAVGSGQKDLASFEVGGNQRNRIGQNGNVYASMQTAIPAGGAANTGYFFSSTAGFGVYYGSGAPTVSAAKGSLYLRSDGSGTTDRAYINTDGGTTWTAITTAA